MSFMLLAPSFFKQADDFCAQTTQHTVAVAWNGRRGHHHVSFFLPHRSTVATHMHLNRALLPFLRPILLSADMAQSPACQSAEFARAAFFDKAQQTH